jgi:hypothetical protein
MFYTNWDVNLWLIGFVFCSSVIYIMMTLYSIDLIAASVEMDFILQLDLTGLPKTSYSSNMFKYWPYLTHVHCTLSDRSCVFS